MPKAKFGINPVTIRGKDQYGRTLGLTLSRLWITGPDGKTHKPMCACMSLLDPEDPYGDNVEPIAVIKVEEELFASGLYHLFPQGEMDQAGENPPAVNRELFEALEEIVTSLAVANCDPSKYKEIDIAKYKQLLDRCRPTKS